MVAQGLGRALSAPEALWAPLLAEGQSVGKDPADLTAASLLAATLAAAEREGLDAPVLLGHVYEATLSAPAKRRQGAFYTPAAVARGLVAVALDGLVGPAGPGGTGTSTGGESLPVVLDPAVGAGAFLLAAARQLRHTTGRSAGECVAAVRGCDIDANAVLVARCALAWWSWAEDGEITRPASSALRCADGLAGPLAGGPADQEATLVIGNPPFLNQLQGPTARSAGHRAQLQSRFGAAAKGYVDTATLFLLAGLDAVAPGGRVMLVQPESMLVASHGAAARAALARQGELEGLWVGGAGIFAAGVRVCAPLLRRKEGEIQRPAWLTPGPGGAPAPAPGPARSVRLWQGPDVTHSGRFDVDSPQRQADLLAGEWAPVLAASRGVPSVSIRRQPTLAELATATAGFRDQFYGLAPFVVEAVPAAAAAAGPSPSVPVRPGHGDELVPGLPAGALVTSGAIAVAANRWGQRPTRFAGQVWQRPVVDVAALESADPKLYRWVSQRLRPKLLVATQTKVLTAAIDPHGRCVPSVPVISVEPYEEDSLWLIAAVLWAPVVSVAASGRFAGAGLSAAALRLSARQVLSLPLPVDTVRWREAADGYRHVVERSEHDGRVHTGAGWSALAEPAWSAAGELMAQAYGIDVQTAALAHSWWRATM